MIRGFVYRTLVGGASYVIGIVEREKLGNYSAHACRKSVVGKVLSAQLVSGERQSQRCFSQYALSKQTE